MSEFTLFKQKISFLESSDRYYLTTLERSEAMRIADKDFKDYYLNRGNMRAVLEQYMESAGIITKLRALDILFKKLPNADIYDVTENKFSERCWNLDEAGKAFDEIVDLYNEIEEELALEKAYREERKNSRSQWEGGGFGLGGAIKGAAAAGALNMASGLGHSLVNAFGNASSERTAANAKERLYNNNETFAKLSMGVQFSIWDIYDEYMMLVNEHYPDKVYFANNEFDEEKAEALFKNAKNIAEKREELLVAALRVCPYYADLLIYIFENYPDERKAVSEMAAFYKVDISSCYENVLATQYNKADKSSEESLLDAKASILASMSSFGVKNSEALNSVNQRYLQLVYEQHYKNALVGERNQALEKIKNLDATKELKKAFVKDHNIWELQNDLHVDFSAEAVHRIVLREYQLLQTQKAAKDKIEATFQDLLPALGLVDRAGLSREKQRADLFMEICGKELKADATVFSKTKEKEALLTPIFDYWKTEASSFSVKEKIYLVYEKGAANELLRQQEIVDLEPGEYIVILYTSKLGDNEKYKTGLVVTDRRVVCKGCGKINHKLTDNVSVKAGGFFDASLVFSGVGYPNEVELDGNVDKKLFAELLQKTFEKLQKIQEKLREIDAALAGDKKKQLAQVVQKNDFLVQCLQLQSWAKNTVSAGDNAVKEDKQRQIKKIVDSLESTSPASVAKAWCELEQSGIDAELIAKEEKKLYQYLMDMVKSATSYAHEAEIEEACQTIFICKEDERMQSLRAAMDARHEDVVRLEEIKRQERETAKIMNCCKTSDLQSVLTAWDVFLESGCEASYYESYLAKLDAAILKQVDEAKTISVASAIRDQLEENNKKRYEKHIQYAEEKMQALDVAERTYRGVLFDAVEDIAVAKEEEMKLDIIMRSVAQDDVQSIENAIAEVSLCPSLIKNVYLDTLNTYKQALDQKSRCFQNVIYDTMEQAEEAKRIYVTLRDLMNTVNLQDEESVLRTKEQITAMNHPITEESLKVLQESLDRIDVQKRTVDGILLATLQEADVARQEYARIKSHLATLDENDEPAMLAIQKDIGTYTTAIKDKYLKILQSKLDEYDVRARTFRGVIYETRELAAKHGEEATIVNKIMQTVSADDEQSMLVALKELKKLTTDEKNIPITTITAWLEEYDIKVRTVAGVLYDTREEAQLVASEIRRAEEIMQKVSADDEQSILNAQREILELTTFIKGSKYEILNQMWQDYDLKARTYLEFVFETRKQAQSAKEEHEEFLRQFNTLDLSQRNSLVILNNFVEDHLPPELTQQTLEMIENVRKVLDMVDYILQKDAAITDMVAQKKESAELYKQIEAVLPSMTYFRINTEHMQQLKTKHYASLNAAKKLFSFLKSKL